MSRPVIVGHLKAHRTTRGRPQCCHSPLTCVAQEPQTSIRPAKEVDLVAGELETSQTQLGDRLHPIERKSDAQVLIGEQLLDDHSNARL